jgi:hypothetical protein
MATFAKTGMHFKTIVHAAVPQGRNGKHKEIVSLIFKDLNRLKGDAALRIPLTELPDTKENIRSALNRAARKANRKVATASDGSFLYIWNTSE